MRRASSRVTISTSMISSSSKFVCVFTSSVASETHMNSVVKPGVVQKRALSISLPARYPVSSSSSRRAASSGSSPGLRPPAQSSSNWVPAACRYWRMRTTSPLSSRGTTQTAPGCTTISSVEVFPAVSTTRSRRTSMCRPLNATS